MKYYVLIFTIVIIIIIILLSKNNVESFDAINEIKYSNTQGEIAFPSNSSTKAQYYSLDKNIINKIERLLDDPPKNDSTITDNELSELLEKQEIRDKELYDKVYHEDDHLLDAFIKYIQENGIDINIDMNKLKHDLRNINIYIYILKKYHDRVRPTILMKYMNDHGIRDEILNPIIEVPSHPAYPSGHATQAKFLSNYFTYYDPENKIIYDNISENISRNRERAGVHYKSDTDAGYKLADILFNILLKHDLSDLESIYLKK